MPRGIQEKGILAKFLEQGIRLFLKKQCKNTGNIKIDIVATSIQIIKGEIEKINIIAEDINYKDLLFDKIELETSEVKINFQLKNKELNFKNNPTIKFRISLSELPLKTFLFSKNWNWIETMITKNILNQDNLEDIKIKNGKLLMKASKSRSNINKEEEININSVKGKIYLENKRCNTSIQIPIEDKIYIEKVNIDNNIIIFFANSSINF